MNQAEARVLATEIEHTPGGWLAEMFEGERGGRWYLVAARTTDPFTHFVLRNRRDWERVLELLADTDGSAS
jgi:hypothetical protein